MPRPSDSRFSYKFGAFTIDVHAHELRKHGIRMKLQDLPFQVLLALVEKPGELISREELRKRLWADGTFVDFDHGISSAVNKLRATLNDSARTPHYIETAGRRGYRFLYPVKQVTAAIPDGNPTPAAPAGRRSWVIAAGVLCGILITGLGTLFWQHQLASHSAAIRSIAVLPLKNLSNDPEEEYFSLGLTDELITQLASLPGLRVISSTSTSQYKNSSKPLPVIAKELNVDAVVEGSVMRSGERVRITAQLIEASTDRHIWAESYERDQRDVFALQSEVTSDIAEKITLKIEPQARQRLASARPVDPQAHEEYLRGRFFFAKRSTSDFNTAIAHFEASIARDPEYAPAYAGLADCYGLIAGYSLIPQDQLIPKGRAAAQRALELDPGLAAAHTSMALIAQNYDWDWATAEHEYRRAIELDPNYATAHQWYAEFLSFMGRFEEAEAEIKRAQELDPLSLIIATDHGVILYYARKYDQSIQQLRNVLAKDPDFPHAHMIAAVYVERGMFSQALADASRFPPSEWKSANLTYIYGRAGQPEKARAEYKKFLDQAKHHNLDPGPSISAALGVGNKEQAFARFQDAYAQHSPSLTSLKVNPIYDPLRSDPRFQDLMRRVGLSQ
jgi:TolB-like protein/DNA-binding winged helix-turn-helix (wHTH) protein/Flp pilus assembly protein TadD